MSILLFHPLNSLFHGSKWGTLKKLMRRHNEKCEKGSYRHTGYTPRGKSCAKKVYWPIVPAGVWLPKRRILYRCWRALRSSSECSLSLVSHSTFTCQTPPHATLTPSPLLRHQPEHLPTSTHSLDNLWITQTAPSSTRNHCKPYLHPHIQPSILSLDPASTTATWCLPLPEHVPTCYSTIPWYPE